MRDCTGLQSIQQSLPPGTVVAVWVGMFQHVGVISSVTLWGLPMVISSSRRRGKAVEETLEEFMQGCRLHNLGFWGNLQPWEVVNRARSMLGKPWSVFNNCEHFVREACGMEPASPQLQGWSFVILLGTLILAKRK